MSNIPARYRQQAALDAQADGIARIYRERRARNQRRRQWQRRSAWIILAVVMGLTAVGVARLLKDRPRPAAIPALEDETSW